MGTRRRQQAVSNDESSSKQQEVTGRTLRARTKKLKVVSDSEDDFEDELEAQYHDEEEDFDEEADRKPKSKKNLKKNSSIKPSNNGKGKRGKGKQKKNEDSMQEEEDESIQGGEEDNNNGDNEVEEEEEGKEQDGAQEHGEYAEDDVEDEISDDYEYDSDEKANKVQRDEVYNLSETDANESWCFICREQGKLICCENCSKTFHLTCVGIKKPPTGAWECPYCREENKDICCACDKSAKEAEIKVTCSLCYRLMHFECLGIPLRQLVDCPMNRNYFLDADTLTILQSINEKDDSEVTNEKMKNLTEGIKKLHSEGKQILYSCFTCIGYFGIDKIQDSVQTEVGACYITKLTNAAYIHSYWLPESVVERRIPRKLKNFKDKKKQVKVQLDEEELEIVLAVEEPIDAFEENIKIERIIDCKRPIKHSKRSYKDIYDSIFSKYGDLYEKQIVFGAKTNYKFLIKWQGLFYDECTFEDEYIVLKYKDILKKYLQIKMFEETIGTPKFQEERENKRIITTQVVKKYKQQPNFITGGSLHKFQIDGVNWLSESYNKQNNVILADEMGLGKTVQTVSFLNFLFYEKNIDGPFMVVAPASTLYNWLREFAIWGDKFNVLVYTGNQSSRSLVRHREFYFKLKNPSKKGKKKKDLVPKFNALITSYDTAINDAHFLRKIQWECLVVDEAHRLKNNESKFFKISSTIQTRHKVLLTGTPLQNNILELLNLIEFICPQKAKTMKNFESLKMFLTTSTQAPSKQQQQQDDQIPEAERKKALSELTKMLGPHLLRRKKTDVDLELPEMEEIIIKISLTDTQKYYYKNVLVKNYDNLKLLDTKSKNFSKFSLLNILMSLRLVCNHPSLFLYKKKYLIPKKDKFQEEFVDCSNKLKFLERMIPKLLLNNHKMLIFSQFTMMLDILGEFFNFKGWAFERLDGTTSVIDRQKTIDAFNQKDSKAKIFLLSTRAGGLGINLTSADTIFFTDSDFNPYRDVQAISRAYRMGQESKVKVYRLVSKYSAEERIIEIATRKLLLESIIINPINKFTKEDFETILKNGTYEMFNKNLEEKDQEFTDEQIDALISREGDMIKGTDVENVSLRKSDLNDYYLSGFKFNSYNFETVDERVKRNDEEEKQKDQKKYWETLLDDQAKQLQNQQASELGKGKRVRKMINSTLQDDHNRTSDSYSEFDGENEKEKSASESDGGVDEVAENYTKKVSSKNNNVASNANNYFQEDQQNKGLVHKNKKTTDKILKYFDEEIYAKSHMKFANMSDIDRFQFVLNGFNEFHRMEFLSFILEFGMDFNSIDQFWLELLKNRSEAFKKDHKPSYMDFKKYLKEFYAALLFYKRLEKLDNAVFCGLSPEQVVRRVGGLSVLRKKYNYFTKKPEKFRVSHKEYSFHQAKVDENNKVEFQKNKWTNYDDYLLVHGVFTVGFGNWEKLLENKILWDYPQDLNLSIWQIIFHKFDEKEDRDIASVDEELGQKYVIRKLQNRANNIMNFLLDMDEGKKEE